MNVTCTEAEFRPRAAAGCSSETVTFTCGCPSLPVAADWTAVLMDVMFGWLKILFASMKNLGWNLSQSLKKVLV